MLIPCCFSVRIQMVLVAPVRTSSSTNQIHVTHTERKEGREETRKETRKNLKERGVTIQQAFISQTFFFFNNIYILYIVPMQNCITLQSRVLSIPPPTHTHMHGLSAKKPNYLPSAKALQPRSTILGPTLDEDRGQRSEGRSEQGDILLFLKRRDIRFCVEGAGLVTTK